MLAALLTQAVPPLGLRDVPKELERILFKCLEREPQNRYDDVMELAADLDRLIAPLHESATRVMHTPAPVLLDAEATVVAAPRPKRGTGSTVDRNARASRRPSSTIVRSATAHRPARRT
jgi:hypothetical protein